MVTVSELNEKIIEFGMNIIDCKLKGEMDRRRVKHEEVAVGHCVDNRYTTSSE